MKAPPKYVLNILSALGSAGHEAVLAGGCVRDSLLGRRPSDWDAATSAPPEVVLGLFKRTAPTGLRHGTVTVLVSGRAVEVTTYRAEGAYSDHRRPDSVEFTGDLALDLSRRDFTMNAMAMGPEGDITDPFGGREDIARRLIRCVGEPERRFGEDALRMLRALRFSAQLGFDIDPRTDAAVTALAPTAAALSAERVRDEFLRALASPRPQRAWEMLTRGLLARFAAAEGEAPPLAALPVYARLAHLCFELERRGFIASTEGFLTQLRLPRAEVRTAVRAAAILRSGSRDYKRLLRDCGESAVLAAYPKSRALRRVLRGGECWDLAHLALDGDALRALGLSGREVGAALARALDYVIDHPAANREDTLLSFIRGEIDTNGKDA